MRRKPKQHSHSTKYRDYIQSDRWRALRLKTFSMTNNRCVGCGDKCTECHHLSYDNLGKERIGIDIVPLCSKCHKKCHYKKYWDNKKNRAIMSDQLIKKFRLMS